MSSCPSSQPTSSTYCYCSGSSGSGTSTVYSLNIARVALLRSISTPKAFITLNANVFGGSSKTLDIGNLPLIYEEVLASVQIDGDAAQTLTSTSTNITVPSGTDIDLTFCATNLLTGNTVFVGGSTVTLTNDCINQTFPSGTASVNFGYTQPSGNCDTGRTFSIGLTVPTTAASTESGDSGSNVGAIVGGICGAFGGIFGASMGVMWWCEYM